MKIPISIVMFATLVLTFACGGAANNAANSSKSNSNNSASNSSSSSNSDTKTSVSDADKKAIDEDAYDFFSEVNGSPDPKAYIGRSATVKNLDLKEIESSTLHLGYSWYFYVECEGSFSEYMSVRDVVAKRSKDNPVQATIKGVIKEASKDKVTLDPCVLTDVKK